VQRRFELQTIEINDRAPTRVGALKIAAYPVAHASGARSYGLRVVREDKTVAYSGDTEWTDKLMDLADRADLFICELSSELRNAGCAPFTSAM